jgi:hypothetical protein
VRWRLECGLGAIVLDWLCGVGTGHGEKAGKRRSSTVTFSGIAADIRVLPTTGGAKRCANGQCTTNATSLQDGTAIAAVDLHGREEKRKREWRSYYEYIGGGGRTTGSLDCEGRYSSH